MGGDFHRSPFLYFLDFETQEPIAYLDEPEKGFLYYGHVYFRLILM